MDEGSKGQVMQSPVRGCSVSGPYLRSNESALKDFKQKNDEILSVFS